LLQCRRLEYCQRGEIFVDAWNFGKVYLDWHPNPNPSGHHELCLLDEGYFIGKKCLLMGWGCEGFFFVSLSEARMLSAW